MHEKYMYICICIYICMYVYGETSIGGRFVVENLKFLKFYRQA